MAGQFRIDKEVFCIMWANNLEKNAGWRNFCLDLFDRFEKSNLERLWSDGGTNAYTHTEVISGTTNAAKDSQYNFMSDRCYTKCTKVNDELVKDKFAKQPLPSGWEKRNGPRGRKSLSTEDIFKIFSGARTQEKLAAKKK